MKKLTFIILSLVFATFTYAQNGGEITGKVVDKVSNMSIPGAHLILKSDSTIIDMLATDDNGGFVFKPLKPGTYDISIIYVGYDTSIYSGLEVKENGINFQIFAIGQGIALTAVIINPSLVDDQVPGVLTTFSEEMIGDMPVGSIQDVAKFAPAVHSNERTGGLHLGGSREDATMYVVDGVKVIGSLYIPMNSIHSITVITGGIPANYGDFTGGIIEVTTKGYAGIY